MIVRDPGHRYQLRVFDGHRQAFLQFVKRNRPAHRYPGNADAECGTMSQEVLRVLIDRAKYLDAQEGAPENPIVLSKLREALYQLEARGARYRGLALPEHFKVEEIESYPVCEGCGHIFCQKCTRHVFGSTQA